MKLATPEKVLLQYAQQLSEEAVQQLIDFAQFLRQKQVDSPQNDVDEALMTASAAQAIHLEEEFENYQQRYPREHE